LNADTIRIRNTGVQKWWEKILCSSKASQNFRQNFDLYQHFAKFAPREANFFWTFKRTSSIYYNLSVHWELCVKIQFSGCNHTWDSSPYLRLSRSCATWTPLLCCWKARSSSGGGLADCGDTGSNRRAPPPPDPWLETHPRPAPLPPRPWPTTNSWWWSIPPSPSTAWSSTVSGSSTPPWFFLMWFWFWFWRPADVCHKN
jgi:hypothetical protein